ncbi:hypothetical protein ABL78_8200 [Leptomonas seymouri]|uniref:Uncharacterized protein n=1 Tax=Leptomonas seymouri TaxID=5684 RepID=A0A0N0P2Q7_LEPSE|nr:hypothetical protein ABL78_8200 [Leptomonas seymouri]|eukprot:KPI82787.1 hypothetical protein ABL78_8200 [Leptomonas seymouri]
MFAEKEAFEDRAYVHVSKALGANATTTSRVASAPSTPSAVSIAVPKVDSNAINATNVLYVPEVVRRPSGGSSAAATKPSPPAPALYPRALCQETSGSPLETDTLTHVASCNLVSANLTECGNNTNPKARAPLSTLPVTSLHLSRRGSAARLRELKELTPMPVPLTLVPVSPDCPLALQQQGSNVSSGKSVEPLDVPSSEGSASSLTSALAPMTREGTEERKSAKARSQQPSTGPSAPTYRTFAVHWPPSPLAGVQPVAKAKQLQTQPFMENVHCRSPSVEPMRVTSPLMPLSATPTALNSARTSRTSSRMSHVAAADEAALGSTSAMRRAVLPPRLLSPSLPLPFSRRSSRDDTSATPVGACTATASPFLTVNYRSPSFSAHPKDERGSSLARPVVPLQVASVAASQEMSSGGGNSGLALTPSLNLRGAGSNLQLDLRERSPTLTPTEGAAVKTGRDAWPCTRSAAALPGITITTASRPISPLYTTGAPALLSPSALQPIKATPQQSPLHFLAPHPQRNRSKSSAFSSKEESSASFTKLLCDDAHE